MIPKRPSFLSAAGYITATTVMPLAKLQYPNSCYLLSSILAHLRTHNYTSKNDIPTGFKYLTLSHR
jgi:hypothetical protein